MKSNRLKRMEKWHEDNATEKSGRQHQNRGRDGMIQGMPF